MPIPNINPFGKAVSEEKILIYQPIRNKNCLSRPCLLTDRAEMRIGPVVSEEKIKM